MESISSEGNNYVLKDLLSLLYQHHFNPVQDFSVICSLRSNLPPKSLYLH